MQNYLEEIQTYYKDINSSEISYRTPFQKFLENIFKREDGYRVQHDAKSVGGNKPDFIVIKNNVPILYIEVKKVGENLDKVEKSEQASRYFGYTNLIISDYVNFRFYRNGEKVDEEFSLGTIDKINKIIEFTNKVEILSKQIFDFPNSHKEPIKNGKVLAKIMGGRGQRLKYNVLEMLKSENEKYKDLQKIKSIIHDSLIKDINDEKFADMYAQTLVYGLFVARYNDKTQNDFSRGEALTLLNKSNPFLYDFFSHIAGANFPERLRYIVDELCEVFAHANVKELMHDYFKSITLFGEVKQTPDPVIHFYEDFLKEYDQDKKMEMGVFYTPKPVVEFIIGGVDEILKREFDIVKGLADTSRTNKKDTDGNFYHKVQVLDVATGTGTFLNTLVEFVYKKYFVEKSQTAGWGDYVKKELLPRLNGFELMIASYTIAHLKLAMTLEETGVSNLDERLRIFLTNTLEEGKKSEWGTGSLFLGLQESITNESIEATKVKTEYPIMCVVGNPPYSGISQNKNYIDNNVYKVEIGGKEKLKERKNWLDDDYVKFIRFGESLVENNHEGIVAMITAHGFIENPTFRGMRWHLRNTFDKIYVLDLHGNSRKKETANDGGKDENVFDIMTGVSIFFGIKKTNSKNKKLAQVYKSDIFGKRGEKFEFLHTQNLQDIN